MSLMIKVLDQWRELEHMKGVERDLLWQQSEAQRWKLAYSGLAAKVRILAQEHVSLCLLSPCDRSPFDQYQQSGTSAFAQQIFALSQVGYEKMLGILTKLPQDVRSPM